MKELLFTDLTPKKDFISDWLTKIILASDWLIQITLASDWLTQNTTDLTLTLVDTGMFDRTGERRD